MEKHGIGTDASIPTHINNITVRNYVSLGPGRTLVPTELGVVLVHGYQRIDPALVLPDTRAAIEASCDQIARGLATKEQVWYAAAIDIAVTMQLTVTIHATQRFCSPGSEPSATRIPGQIRALSSVHRPDGHPV
jgi:DNA topoisomerase IA